MTFGPLIGFILIIVGTHLWGGSRASIFISSMSLGGFIGGGKLVILAGALDTAPIHIWPIAAMVVYGDVATALLIMGNMHYIYRIPALGRKLASARQAGFHVLQVHKWIRRMAETGLILFIAMPFQGTGALLGVILGRILGLSRLGIFLCTLAGSALGSTIVALAATFGRNKITMIAQNPYVGITAVILTLLATILLGRWFLGKRDD